MVSIASVSAQAAVGRASNSTRPMPRLLPIVYLTTLLLVVVSCVALAMLGSAHVLAASTNTLVASDEVLLRGFLTGNLRASELTTGTYSDSRRRQVEEALASFAVEHGLADVVLLAPSGAVMASTGEAVDLVARAPTLAPGAVIGSEPPSGAIPSGVAVTETLPTVANGQPGITAVFRRDAGSIVAAASAAWGDVLIVGGGAGLVLFVALHLIFRAAHLRLIRQERQLRESERRDPLTGLLNRAAVLRELELALQAVPRTGDPLGILLIDVDSFRLLNATHGDDAGDRVLREVAAVVAAQDANWLTCGRFGPDEFLAVTATEVRDLEARARQIQASLAERPLQFGDSEPLVITVSAGISYFPFHASSMTDLISAAIASLEQARAGGGNDVRVTDAHPASTLARRQTFDVLQGLVVAVDAKDRYTKRHSDEVASYSLFLASWIGLSTEFRQSLEMASLLHDVGKIGVPEEILRKPGRLTPAEYDALKQHVSLGDLIVRELPDIETIRLGIRYHHERWDGQGYLAGLAGEEIPLIARLIAVGDTFSAMTSNRPYRAALSLDESFERLRQAAGVQLDPALVEAFLEGLRSAPDAPLPGSDRLRPLLWTSRTAAA